jgi:hypothetical protein
MAVSLCSEDMAMVDRRSMVQQYGAVSATITLVTSFILSTASDIQLSNPLLL